MLEFLMGCSQQKCWNSNLRPPVCGDMQKLNDRQQDMRKCISLLRACRHFIEKVQRWKDEKHALSRKISFQDIHTKIQNFQLHKCTQRGINFISNNIPSQIQYLQFLQTPQLFKSCNNNKKKYDATRKCHFLCKFVTLIGKLKYVYVLRSFTNSLCL